MKDVRVSEALSEGWEGTKNNWPMYLLLFGIYVAAQLVQNLAQKVTGNGVFFGLVYSLISMVVSMALYMLMMKFSLQVAAQKGAKVALFSEMELDGGEVSRFLLTYLLVMLVFFGAMVLCFLPVGLLALVTVGVSVFSKSAEIWKQMALPLAASILVALVALGYLSLVFSQAMYACLHQGLGPVESMKESKRLTDGAKGGLIVFGFASCGLLLAGLICLLVGVIPAAMVVGMAAPIVYLSLLEQSGPRGQSA